MMRDADISELIAALRVCQLALDRGPLFAVFDPDCADSYVLAARIKALLARVAAQTPVTTEKDKVDVHHL